MTTPDLSMFLLAHKGLRRDAAAMAAASRRLDHESADAAAALLDAYAIFEAMLRHHHLAEDNLVWPAIASRRSEHTADLEELEAEHEVAEHWLSEVRLALTALATPGAVDRAAVAVDLVVATSALSIALSAHLEHEERVAVPMIVDVLTGDDWDDIDARRRAGMSPEETATSLSWILSVLPEEDREAAAAAKLPAEVVELWRTAWAPAYSRRVAPLAAAA